MYHYRIYPKTANEYGEILLLNSTLKIQDIAEAVGYSSHSKFSTCFKKYKGFYPKDIKKYTKNTPVLHDNEKEID